MANEEHLKILRQGVKAWNAWREEHPTIKPDLRGTDFRVEVPLPADQILVEGANLEGDYPSRTTYMEGADFPGANFSFTSLKGANLKDANLEGANLRGANLKDANLTGARLTEANLEGARLRNAGLESANLQRANLLRARIYGAHLVDANLRGANLRGAKLFDANLNASNLESSNLEQADLGSATLEQARLSGANLQRANLHRADLKDANLENCDLRFARKLMLDSNLVRGAKFAPHAKDPWSELRRKYTGSMLLFHLLLLALFSIPYGARAMMWLGVNRTQAALLETTAKLEATTADLEARQDLNAEALRRITGQLSQIQPCLEADCESYEVWELLIGVDKGWKYWTLALTLILYNAGRGFLTWSVGPLRDEEERSGYAPALKSYLWLYWLHRVVAVLLFVALAAFAFNAWHWLRTPVWLPG